MLRAFFFCFFLFGGVLHAGGENWARFRGPNGQGHSSEKGLPSKWAEKDYLWTVTLPEMGFSSPVIWGDKVFVTCATKDNSKGWIIAYDTADGNELWKKEYQFKPAKMSYRNSLAAGTPAVDEKYVYVFWTVYVRF